jgi:hypothetical protein
MAFVFHPKVPNTKATVQMTNTMVEADREAIERKVATVRWPRWPA